MRSPSEPVRYQPQIVSRLGVPRVIVGLVLVSLLAPRLAIAAPSITSLTPNTGPVGTSVTIAGSGFGNNQGSSTVTFNGIAATPTNWKQNSITAPVPAGATTGLVIVSVGGVASNGVTFTVTIAPTITSLTPNSGPVGTAVVIAGNNFGATQGSSTVKFNGVTATPTNWTQTSITAPVPTSATTGLVIVTVAGAASNGVTFTVTIPPTITSLTPNSGSVGTSVTIAGTNFGATQGGSTVNFNGVTASPTSWSNTSIVAPVPNFASTGPVTVTVAGATSNGMTFTVPLAPKITYAYDELGRVLVATDQTGNSAAYTYDATGNILSVAQYPAGGVALSAFAPSSGVTGTAVNLYGTGFSTTPSGNTVRFNGTLATVNASSSSQIIVTVPVGATTGPISVTVSGSTATSAATFTIGQPPTITSFTPTVALPGTSIAVTGTNFFTHPGYDDVKVNTTSSVVTTANTTNMTAVVPLAASGRLSVTTPYGSGTSAADLYIPPAPYTPAQVSPLGPGSGRITVGGSKNVTIAAGQVALILFDLTAGQKVSADLAAVPVTTRGFFDPTGGSYNNMYSYFYGYCMDGTVAPMTGTYTLELGNDTNATLDVQTYTVVDLSTPITVGGVAALTNTTMGQELRYTFTLTQSTRVSVVTGMSGRGCPVLSIWDSTGAQVAWDGTGVSCDFGGFVDAVTLPAGSYTLVARPVCYTNLQVTAHLYNAADVTGTLTINRNGKNFSTTIPGQNVALTFTGSAGQLVTPKFTNLSISGERVCAFFSLLGTDGTTFLESSSWCRPDGPTLTMPQFTLPTAGTYKLYVDPYRESTMSLTAAVTSP